MAQMHINVGGRWVPVPLPSELRRGVVFHYTGPDGLVGIVENHEVWASSALALNDLSEMTYGLDVLREAAVGRRDAPGRTLTAMLDRDLLSDLRNTAYFFSASSMDDSLNQWLGYGGRQGYAIGFHASGRLAQKRRDEAEEPPESRPLAGAHPLMGANGWYRVVYDRAKQLVIVSRLLDFCASNGLLADPGGASHGRMIFGQLLPQFKHRAFRDEREARFIVSAVPEADESYRAGKYGVVPFVRLIATEKGEHGSAPQRGLRLPLASVTTGPVNADERQSVLAATSRLLESAGYIAVDVRPSEAPYRF